MISIRCFRCSYEWTYKGLSDWFCNCPRCARRIIVPGGRADKSVKVEKLE